MILRVWLDGVPGELSLALNSRRCDVKWLGQISQAIVFVLVTGCFLSYIVHEIDLPKTDLDVPGQPVASCPRELLDPQGLLVPTKAAILQRTRELAPKLSALWHSAGTPHEFVQECAGCRSCQVDSVPNQHRQTEKSSEDPRPAQD